MKKTKCFLSSLLLLLAVILPLGVRADVAPMPPSFMEWARMNGRADYYEKTDDPVQEVFEEIVTISEWNWALVIPSGLGLLLFSFLIVRCGSHKSKKLSFFLFFILVFWIGIVVGWGKVDKTKKIDNAQQHVYDGRCPLGVCRRPPTDEDAKAYEEYCREYKRRAYEARRRFYEKRGRIYGSQNDIQ